MLLGEPPRSSGDLNFRLFGIPVRVHPFFWLIAVMLKIGGKTELPELLIWVVAVFVSVLIHEMGHALTMRTFGIWPWVTLYGFGGLASYNPGDARRVGPFGHVLISFAGPGSQFILAATIIVVLKAAGYQVDPPDTGLIRYPLPSELVVSVGVTRLIIDLMFVSVYWGVLNLIPVYPLDGGQIAREILVAASPRNGVAASLMLSMVAAGVITVLSLKSHEFFLAIMFGLLGYGSYQTLQAYRNQRGW